MPKNTHKQNRASRTEARYGRTASGFGRAATTMRASQVGAWYGQFSREEEHSIRMEHGRSTGRAVQPPPWNPRRPRPDSSRPRRSGR